MSRLRKRRPKCDVTDLFLTLKRVDTRTVEGNVFRPEDGDSIFLRNVGIYLQVHTALQPRRKHRRALELVAYALLLNTTIYCLVKFKVLTATSMKMAVL
jgi:hypothetical protein